MHWVVYIITNTVNGKIYIGKTRDMAVRWIDHKAKANRGDQRPGLHRAIRKYGPDAFVVRLLASFCFTNLPLIDRRRRLIIQTLM